VVSAASLILFSIDSFEKALFCDRSSDKPRTHLVATKFGPVQVRVWLEDHYYTFSRFLVSRVLSVTKVSYADSLQISLALKKELVDAGQLDVTQAEMERLLFSIMRSKVHILP
jgi:hypothetical protein